VKYPETDPATYESWVQEEWHSYVLLQLKELLLFVRKMPISGLPIGKLRSATFVPFERWFNRQVSLYLNEIEAYNGAWKEPVDDEALARQWKLSGLERP